MKKRKKKNKKENSKILLLIILLLLFFSYFELTNDIRLGGILRDLLFYPTRNIERNSLLNTINEEIKIENTELKEMLDISYSLTDYDIKYAAVVERNNSYWLNELTINKGLNDGVDENFVVVTENGLVGKVISSSFFSSKVKLITNEKNSISVRVNNKNKILTVKDNKLIIKGINKKDNIKINDKVLTSGLSDKYPEGLLIGAVSNVYLEEDKVGYIAEVELKEDINNLRFVALLKRRDK